MQKQILFILLLTVILGCQPDEPTTRHEPRVDYYLESYDLDGLGFQPQLKVVYEYTPLGRLNKYTVLTFNPNSKSFIEQRHFDFLYADEQVTKISVYSPADVDAYQEYTYVYSNDKRVSKIKEANLYTGINSEANFAYDDVRGAVKASYTFSNGGRFEYEFNLNAGNVVKDKTTRGSQLCSDGEYTYDDHINPFHKLGYMDYLLTNLSANNKLSEDVNYINCSFPSLAPTSYTYEYDDLGYPTLMTTFYNSGSTISRSQKKIFYR